MSFLEHPCSPHLSAPWDLPDRKNLVRYQQRCQKYTKLGHDPSWRDYNLGARAVPWLRDSYRGGKDRGQKGAPSLGGYREDVT